MTSVPVINVKTILLSKQETMRLKSFCTKGQSLITLSLKSVKHKKTVSNEEMLSKS